MMIRRVKWLFVLLLFLAAGAAHAQEPGEDAQADESAQAAAKCPPAVDQNPAEADPDAQGEPVDGLADEDCEEAPEELAEIEIPTGMGAVVEEDPSVRATADEVFEPGEEISEDFPVPLPSDI